MKTIFLALCLMFASHAFAEPVKVSVMRFADKTGSSNCRSQYDWWSKHFGDSFRDILTGELSRDGRFEVMEREALAQILDEEVNLENSTDEKRPERNQFEAAQFALIGAVTEYEYCAQSNGGSVNLPRLAGLVGLSTPVPDLEVGLRGAKAEIAVEIRIVEVKTGKILRSVRGTGKASDSKFNLDVGGGGLGYDQQMNSPLAAAGREAIKAAMGEIAEVILKKKTIARGG